MTKDNAKAFANIWVFSAVFASQLLGIFFDEFGDLSIMLTGLQGLVGSGPQVVLQLAAVLEMRSPGPVQLIVFIVAILLISKSVVQYDVLYKEGTTNRNIEISFMRKLKYAILVSPTYITSMIFRIGVLVILIRYLGLIAIIPIILHQLAVCAVAFKLEFEKKDIFILVCTNMCIMSIGPLKTSNKSVRQSRFSFLFYSSLASFIVFSGFLIGLIYAMNTGMIFMEHWNIMILSRCGNILPFNIVSAVILNSGIMNLILLCNSQWGRLDSYLDETDIKNIIDKMERHQSRLELETTWRKNCDKVDNDYVVGEEMNVVDDNEKVPMNMKSNKFETNVDDGTEKNMAEEVTDNSITNEELHTCSNDEFPFPVAMVPHL